MSTESQPVVFAFDVGGTKLAVAATTHDGTIIYRKARSTDAADGAKAVLSRLGELAYGIQEDVTETPVGVGLATHGIVDRRGTVCFASSNMPGWTGTDLHSFISGYFPTAPVRVANDGHAAALAEYLYGTGQGVSAFISLVIGTGVGGGVISNGQLLTGATGGAGRLGHLSVDRDGPFCSCGNRGCLELYVSGTAVAQKAQRLALGKSTSLFGAESVDEITGRSVVRAAQAGDEQAQRLLRVTGQHLGHALLQMERMFDPELIAVGGGMASAGELVLEAAREVVQKSSPPELKPPVVKLARLGADASLVGAGILGWRVSQGQEDSELVSRISI